MCWQWGGIGILWCLISGCLRSPPPTLSCHSSWTCIHFSWCSPRQHWAFRIKHTLTYNLTSTHSKLFLRRDAVFKPDVLETQHQCGEATISGQEAAILVQSVSAALGRYVSQWSQWPSDGTGVPLKWLTDWWCQQRSRESGRLSEYRFYSRSLQMWVCVFLRVFYELDYLFSALLRQVTI